LRLAGCRSLRSSMCVCVFFISIHSSSHSFRLLLGNATTGSLTAKVKKTTSSGTGHHGPWWQILEAFSSRFTFASLLRRSITPFPFFLFFFCKQAKHCGKKTTVGVKTERGYIKSKSIYFCEGQPQTTKTVRTIFRFDSRVKIS
jgi:hypothetical protein